jgi:hypothetical protein
MVLHPEQSAKGSKGIRARYGEKIQKRTEEDRSSLCRAEIQNPSGFARRVCRIVKGAVKIAFF